MQVVQMRRVANGIEINLHLVFWLDPHLLYQHLVFKMHGIELEHVTLRVTCLAKF